MQKTYQSFYIIVTIYVLNFLFVLLHLRGDELISVVHGLLKCVRAPVTTGREDTRGNEAVNSASVLGVACAVELRGNRGWRGVELEMEAWRTGTRISLRPTNLITPCCLFHISSCNTHIFFKKKQCCFNIMLFLRILITSTISNDQIIYSSRKHRFL